MRNSNNFDKTLPYLMTLTAMEPPFLEFFVLFNLQISFWGVYCRPLCGSA